MVFRVSRTTLFILITLVCLVFFSHSVAIATTVQLQWDANTEPDLSGYKVYYNIEPFPLADSVPLDVNNQTTATINGLDPYQDYYFAVTAYNTAGLESSFSNIVSVPAQASPPATDVIDLIAPTVSLTSPVNYDLLSGTVTLRAAASDNVAVSMVEFYINGTLRYASNFAPYNYNWETVEGLNGTYTLRAIAYDNAAHSTQSSAVTVTVSNSAPVTTGLTIADALLALKIGAGKVTPTPEQIARLDVAPVIQSYSTPDGKIDTGDAIVILSIVVGKPVG